MLFFFFFSFISITVKHLRLNCYKKAHYCRTQPKWVPLCTESSQFLMITETQWDCPDQHCCPCADKWFPLSKGPTPHLDKQFHHENTFNKYLLINVLSKLKAGLLVCGPDTVHVPQNLWQADTWKTRLTLSLKLRCSRFSFLSTTTWQSGFFSTSKSRNKRTSLLHIKSPSEFLSRNMKNSE